jgi:hypothetical protein
MKRKVKNILLSLLAVGVFSVISTVKISAQAAQDFTLVNKTGVEIYALYVTPHNAGDWGDDILGADTLSANGTLDITFARKEKAELWDVRIEDESGAFIEWENLNLLRDGDPLHRSFRGNHRSRWRPSQSDGMARR